MEGVLTTAEKKMKRMNQWYRNKQDIFCVFDYVVSGKKKKKTSGIVMLKQKNQTRVWKLRRDRCFVTAAAAVCGAGLTYMLSKHRTVRGEHLNEIFIFPFCFNHAAAAVLMALVLWFGHSAEGATALGFHGVRSVSSSRCSLKKTVNPGRPDCLRLPPVIGGYHGESYRQFYLSYARYVTRALINSLDQSCPL